MKNLLFSLIHGVKMKFSPTYRRAYLLKQGEKVWDRLELNLPPAVGSISADKHRIRMFKKQISHCSKDERNALKIFLMTRTRYWHENFAEHSFGKVEEIERKHWQIYSTHLEALYEYERGGFK